MKVIYKTLTGSEEITIEVDNQPEACAEEIDRFLISKYPPIIITKTKKSNKLFKAQ